MTASTQTAKTTELAIGIDSTKAMNDNSKNRATKRSKLTEEAIETESQVENKISKVNKVVDTFTKSKVPYTIRTVKKLNSVSEDRFLEFNVINIFIENFKLIINPR